MMMNKFGLSLLILLGVCFAPTNLWAKAAANKSVALAVGKAQTLTLPEDMADVLVADPSVVNVGALKSNQLYLVGLKNGATNILVFDKAGHQIMNYNVQISVDNSTLQNTLSTLLPGQNIKVTSVNDDIVLSGNVDNPMTSSRARDIAGRYLRPMAKGAAIDAYTKGWAGIWGDKHTALVRDLTLHVHETLWPRLQAEPGLLDIYQRFELPTSRVLQRIERNGVLIDADLLRQQSHELGQRIMALEQEAYELAGQPFNLGSPKQLGEILFVKQGLPIVKKTASGAPSTNEEVLEKLAEDYPLPARILEYRGMAKLKSTYTDKLPLMVNAETGRVHTNYAQAVAVTGRLSSNDPNLQNIPVRTAEGRRIREAFVAPPGHVIVSADYSQIELRIMAHISQDENLLRAFAEGVDVHKATASEVFGVPVDEVSSEQRRYAKVINFGLIYGMSAHGLAKNLGIERAAAANYIDRYFARYPGVAAYMERTRLEAKQKGYVETVFGRRLHLPDIRAQQVGRRQAAERAAINAPMQGTAADLIKKAMIAVSAWLKASGVKSRLILQVHDELVLEVPDAEVALIREQLPRLMAEVAQLSVPLLAEVGVGANWDEAH